jgi:hypothetical protein
LTRAEQTYDDNYLRHTLEKAGIINTPAQAKRDECVASLRLVLIPRDLRTGC